MIGCMVTQWDNVPPNAVSSLDMGKALLGVVTHSAKNVSMNVTPDNVATIADKGTTDNVNTYIF